MREEMEKENDRTLKVERVKGPLGEHVVSTIRLNPAVHALDMFLGLYDDRMREPGDWETAIFDGSGWDRHEMMHLYQRKYLTEEAAIEGHEEVVGDLEKGAVALIDATTYAFGEEEEESK